MRKWKALALLITKCKKELKRELKKLFKNKLHQLKQFNSNSLNSMNRLKKKNPLLKRQFHKNLMILVRLKAMKQLKRSMSNLIRIIVNCLFYILFIAIVNDLIDDI